MVFQKDGLHICGNTFKCAFMMTDVIISSNPVMTFNLNEKWVSNSIEHLVGK